MKTNAPKPTVEPVLSLEITPSCNPPDVKVQFSKIVGVDAAGNRTTLGYCVQCESMDWSQTVPTLAPADAVRNKNGKLNWTRPVARAEADAFRQFLQSALINPIPETRYIVDGTQCILTINNGCNRVVYEWSVPVPPQWLAIQKIVDSLLRWSEIPQEWAQEL